jgi:molecular chaperone HtpG
VRELLQNGIDAITARQSLDESFSGEINIYTNTDQSEIVFVDNGIGQTEDEIHKFLSVIGQSSKRDDILEKDFIGKFGIGLLSCFVVSNEITMETRSLFKKGKGIRWKGKADGTYTVEKIKEKIPYGTKVILYPKREWKTLFEATALKNNILFFGNALPVQINMITDDKKHVLVDRTPVWLDPDSSQEELLKYGLEAFNIDFLDAFRIKAETGEIEGVGFIMPYRIQFSSAKEHKIYMKRMYLCDQANNLFPEWTSFVKCIINTNTLRPTASREALMNDNNLRHAKKEINASFKEYLTRMTYENPEMLGNIISIHNAYIKALAAEDSQLLKLFVDFLPFETNKGVICLGELRDSDEDVFYTLSLYDFKQIRRIAGSQGKMVINAAYSFENELIRKIAAVFPEFRLTVITPQEILSSFGETPANDQQFILFEKKANMVLKENYCKARIKKFEPQDTPVIYIADDDALDSKDISSPDNNINPFASAIPVFAKNKEKTMSTLCFNKDNSLISDLIGLDDDTIFEAVINILYVQSLMLGNYPVNKKEMTTFNDSVYKLIIMGMSNFSQHLNLDL